MTFVKTCTCGNNTVCVCNTCGTIKNVSTENAEYSGEQSKKTLPTRDRLTEVNNTLFYLLDKQQDLYEKIYGSCSLSEFVERDDDGSLDFVVESIEDKIKQLLELDKLWTK